MTDDEWARLWKVADERYDALCMDIMGAIADGKGLAEVLDLVGDSMDNCDRVDEESAALFNKAKERVS
jgi:hypothetical protein